MPPFLGLLLNGAFGSLPLHNNYNLLREGISSYSALITPNTTVLMVHTFVP